MMISDEDALKETVDFAKTTGEMCIRDSIDIIHNLSMIYMNKLV